MKAWAAVLLTLLTLGTGAHAQEFVAPGGVQEEMPVIPVPTEPRPSMEGIVAEIFNVKKPWQLVNPAAPAEYGNGRTNGTVTYAEEDAGKPKGFIVLALDW